MNKFVENLNQAHLDLLLDRSYREERSANFTLLIAITIVLGLGFWWWIRL